MTIKDLQPKLIWNIFDEIPAVPRPSKHEEKIIEYLLAFAAKHSLECERDEIGNVVIRKGATPGYESLPTVILQSHIDMVCEKNSDTAHNFDTDPIRTKIVDGWVKAEGTTLGADCGIGMAAALAVLVDPEVEHGAIEALFTVDEETGLTGAFNLGKGMLTGKYLINLDSEDEGEVFIGCAGGVDTLAHFDYTTQTLEGGYDLYRINVSGLKGGHSGDDIDKGLGNANKILANFLYDAQRYGIRLGMFDGGNLRNAIPREAYAVVAVPEQTALLFETALATYISAVKALYAPTEPNLKITVGEAAAAQSQEAEEIVCLMPNTGKKNTVVVISSNAMGHGGDELGVALMKGFLYALSQQEQLPSTILFYNGGASITCEGSVSLEDLKSMEAQGVEILTCGTCLNFYGLTEKLAVGSVTNMYTIVEKMTGADLIVKP